MNPRHVSRALLLLSSTLLLISSNNTIANTASLCSELDPKFSNDEKYLAVKHCLDGEPVVSVYILETRSLVNIVQLPARNIVGDFWWANESRLVVSVLVLWNDGASIDDYSELYTVEADGSQGRYLAGHRSIKRESRSSRARPGPTAMLGARFIDAYPKDRRKILVKLLTHNKGDDVHGLIDVYSGRVSRTRKSVLAESSEEICSGNETVDRTIGPREFEAIAESLGGRSFCLNNRTQSKAIIRETSSGVVHIYDFESSTVTSLDDFVRIRYVDA